MNQFGRRSQVNYMKFLGHQIRNQIWSICDRGMSHIEVLTKGQVSTQVNFKVSTQITAQIREQILHQLYNQVLD